MSLGLGHKYWVRVIKHFIGTMEECIKFMQDNAPSSSLEWFELHPDVNINKGKRITCDRYRCDLVEDGSSETH